MSDPGTPSAPSTLTSDLAHFTQLVVNTAQAEARRILEEKINEAVIRVAAQVKAETMAKVTCSAQLVQDGEERRIVISFRGL